MKNLSIRSSLLLTCIALIASPALAQTLSQTGKLTGYIPSQANGKQIFVVQLQGNVTGGCNSSARFAINSDSLSFKTTAAALMAAYHAQSDVTIFYSQSCTALGNAWDLGWACVGNVPC
jgi:hypothetical protein